MFVFDESLLIGRLEQLDHRGVLCFAVAAVARQWSNVDLYAKHVGIPCVVGAQALIDIWRLVRAGVPIEKGADVMLNEVMDLLPDESDEWGLLHSLAEDAISSLAYSARYLMSASVQESAWAARRAYEAADQAAIKILGADLNESGIEHVLLSSEVVQRELGRQHRDLHILSCPTNGDPIEKLYELSSSESLLLTSEVVLLRDYF